MRKRHKRKRIEILNFQDKSVKLMRIETPVKFPSVVRLTSNGTPWYVETFYKQEEYIAFVLTYQMLSSPSERMNWLKRRNNGTLLQETS